MSTRSAPGGAPSPRPRWGVDPRLVAVLGVAFALRVGWVLLNTHDPVFVESGDAYSYWFYGRQIAEGGGYLNLDGSGRATAYYPIGYPALLGAVFWFVLHTPLPDDLTMAASLLNVVLGTASVGLLYLVTLGATGATGGSRRTALVAAALLALWPNAVFHTATVLLETTFTFAALLVLAILATHRWEEGPPSWRRMALFGGTLGAAALIRPFALPFLVLPILLLVLRRVPLRTVAASTVAAVVPLALVLVPWTLRNAAAMGAALPFSSNTGDTLCIDRNVDAEGGFRWADHDGCADPTLGEVERNRANTAKAVEFVTQHPGREALQIVRRARLILRDDHDGLDTVERYGRAPVAARAVLRRLADAWYLAALVAAGVGLVRALRERPRPELLLLVLPPLALVGIAVLLWGTPRFHVPAIPFLAGLAARATGEHFGHATPHDAPAGPAAGRRAADGRDPGD